MKISTVIIGICLPFLWMAQKYYGITGGVIAGNVLISIDPKVSDINQPYNMKLGMTFGATLGGKLNNNIGINTALKYQEFISSNKQDEKLKRQYLSLSLSPEYYYYRDLSIVGGVSASRPLNDDFPGTTLLHPMGHLGLAVTTQYFRVEILGIRSIGAFGYNQNSSHRTNYYHRACQLTFSYILQ